MSATPDSLASKVLRSIAYYWSRPAELYARLSSEVERGLTTEERQGIDSFGVRVSTDPIHELLTGQTGSDCPVCTGVDEALEGAAKHFSGSHHHDSAKETATATWQAVLHLEPERIVETGVARGFTSAAILTALERNGHGELWSIDLPEVALLKSGEAGAAVSPELRAKWHWVRGSSRTKLPAILRQNRPLDVFIHDSLHTRRTMLFEMNLAWEHLRAGGLLIVDDADLSTAFATFVATTAAGAECLVQEKALSPGALGVILKPARPGAS